jgi:acetylornithine deacetylase
VIGDDDWISASLARLVAISSRSGAEQRAQNEVERLIREAGAEVRRVPVDANRLRDRYGFASPTPSDGMFAVVGRWGEPRDGAPFVVLNGHVDTVAPTGEWAIDPLDPRITDGWMNGLGTADMKAGLVSAIAAAGRAAASGELRGIVEVQSVPDEEAGGGTGSLTCIDELVGQRRRPDLVVVCEPTARSVATAQVGSRAMRFRVRGLEAHANTKAQGVNAIEAALALAGRLAAWADRPERGRHPLLPAPSVNVGRITGGVGATTVAADCEFEVCFTYHPGDAADLAADVDAAVAAWRAGQDPRVAVESVELHNVRPFETDPELPVVRALRAAVDGGAGASSGFPAGSDGRLFHEVLGSPTVIFGPGDIRRIHRANEAVELADVAMHTAALASFLTAPALTAPSPTTTQERQAS